MSHNQYMKIYMRKWTKKNPEKRKAIADRYYARHQEELQEKMRQFYKDGLPQTRVKARKQQKKYNKTKRGYQVIQYNSMQAKVRGTQSTAPEQTGLPLMSRKDYYKFVQDNPEFQKLWGVYKRSGRDRACAPVPHRKNPSRGYTEKNLTFKRFADHISIRNRKKK